MRIVAGSARGRRIAVPAGTGVRPSTERVREAVFNSLHSAGLVVDATYLDLFSGSGALGLEALSRGAAHVTFVDSDRRSLDTVRANLDALGLADRATVRAGDGRALAAQLDAVDVALCDPPYGFDGWDDLLGVVRAGVVMIESDRPVDPGPGWAILKQKRYGTSVVTLAQRREPSSG